MDIVKIVSITLCSLFIIILLKKISPEQALLATIFTNSGICVFSLIILSPVFEYIKSLSVLGEYSDFCIIMFKSASVCFLCSIASELCRDCGEAGLSSKIEFAGKATLLTFSLPLIKQVFEYATTFID